MKNASKSGENENRNIEAAKKAYVKPVVAKHTAATQIVGSGCSTYQASSYCNPSCGVYYV
jgi:hypothetical protein